MFRHMLRLKTELTVCSMLTERKMALSRLVCNCLCSKPVHYMPRDVILFVFDGVCDIDICCDLMIRKHHMSVELV